MNAEHFICGAIGGLSSLAVGHPFDTIKVRLQTRPDIYRSGYQTLKLALLKEGGISSLYKGIGAVAPGVSFVYASWFYGFETGKRIFCGDQTSNYRLALAGAFSALFTAPITGPSDRVKVLAQISNSNKNQKPLSSKQVFLQLIKNPGGLKNVFRSKDIFITFIRDAWGSAFYFAIYELLKQDYFKKNPDCKNKLPIFESVIYGSFVGVVYWFTCIPIDNVKSRLQSSQDDNIKIRTILRDIRTSGIRNLYRGMNVMLMRAVPAHGACFLGYEQSKRLFFS